MAEDASHWVTYDEAADLLGVAPETARRLSLRNGWRRRSTLDGRPQVALPERLDEGDVGVVAGRDDDPDDGGARSLLGYLERRVDELTEELAESRTEARGARFEAESLRVEAGRVGVLVALIEVERTRLAEMRAERDRISRALEAARRPWLARFLLAMRDRRGWRRRRTDPPMDLDRA